MNMRKMAGMAVTAMLLAAGMAQADITIETVRVGNAGNTGELSGDGAYGYGPDRICGAVAYTYNIGKYEVTAGQYTAFLNAVAVTDAYGLYNTNMDTTIHSYGCGITRTGSSGSYAYSVTSDWANRPVNFVSWGDSVRFANWMTNGQGNGSTETGAYALNGATTNAQLLAVGVPSASQRATWSTGATSYFLLTSEDEWYKAAYYKGGSTTAGYWDYPTSSNATPSNDLTTPDGGNNANFNQSGYTVDSPYYRTPVGEFKLSDSPYGTFDQGGNVVEWNEAFIKPEYTAYRGLRGGSFLDVDSYLLASVRDYRVPAAESGYIGFRVSEVPAPATLVGDTNDDGVVDVADYITLKQNFGMTGAGWAQGNFNADIDGDVDWDDLQLLMANFGTRSVGGAPSAPEPATLSLLALLALSLPKRGGLAMIRRKRR